MAVNTADKIKAVEPYAPLTEDSADIVAVPKAWLAEPIAKPRAIGSFIPSIFNQLKPKTLPPTPATITNKAARAGEPPSCSDTSIEIAVVIHMLAIERNKTSSAPNNLANNTAEVIATNDAITLLKTTKRHCFLRFLSCL